MELNKIKIIKTKNDEEMCFASANDTTGSINDIVIFPITLKKYKNLIFENNVVLLIGQKGQKGNFIVNEMKQV
jgi:DNA polymerase III alpha subunit